MKKAVSAIMTSVVFALGLIAFGSIDANAQAYCRDGRNDQVRYERRSGSRDRQGRWQNDRYYDEEGYYYGKEPNIYDRHRKAINLSVGTAAGAAVGAAVGGKRGALIGAGVGLATGAIVTKVQKPRNYPRY